MKRLNEIKLGVSRGARLPFCTAHVFAPEGTLFITGTRDKIREFLSVRPACHGVVTVYMCRGGVRWKFKTIEMFGRDTSSGVSGLNKSSHYLVLYKLSCEEAQYQIFFEELIKRRLLSKRRLYYIIDFLPDTHRPCVLGSWRTMPSCYLRELAEFERQKLTSKPISKENIQ